MDKKLVSAAVVLIALCVAISAYLLFPVSAESKSEKVRIDALELRPLPAGEAMEVEVHGAGFGDDPRVSMALDVANRASIVARLETWSALQDVAVAGDVAVLANGGRGVLIADVSSVQRPLILGSVEVDDNAISVDIRGDLAYVACAKGGVAVVDFSRPENPFVVDRIFLPGVCWDVWVVDDYVYVGAGESGLHVLDNSRPGALRLLATLPLAGHSVDLAFFDASTLLVASVQGGVHLVDISDPLRPSLDGTIESSQPVMAVGAGGGLAFAADMQGNLRVFDIDADPRDPPVLGSLELPGRPTDIFHRQGRLYLGAVAGVHVVDVSAPVRPRLVGTVGVRNARSVVESDDRVFVANSKGGLAVIDQGRIEPLQVFDHLNTQGSSRNLRVVDRTVFLAEGPGGLSILDLGTDGKLRSKGRVALEGMARDVAVEGRHAYVASYRGNMDIVDVAEPEDPRLAGSVETMGMAMSVRLYNGLALVMSNKVRGRRGEEENMTNGLQIFDLADPVRPRLLASLPLEEGRTGNGIAVDEKRKLVFVVAGSTGVFVVDIADPANPAVVGRYTLPWPEYSFSPMIDGVYRDGVLFVANGRNGLLAFDTSDQSNPRLVGVLQTTDSAIGISLAGDRAYLSVGEGGIDVADISDPADMRLTARLDLPIYARRFAVKGQKLILGNGHRGLFVIPPPAEGEVLSATPTKIVCRFPKPALPGTYRLGVFGEGSFAEAGEILSLPPN